MYSGKKILGKILEEQKTSIPNDLFFLMTFTLLRDGKLTSFSVLFGMR